MKPATHAHRLYEQTKLMVVEPETRRVQSTTVAYLEEFFQAGDLLVVNRSGTLPASFTGIILSSGQAVELRLAAFRGTHKGDISKWAAVLFGNGDWRLPTEQRGAAPQIAVGERIQFKAV